MAGRLRARQIQTLPPGRHGDGGTLYLVVEPRGRSRHWVQRLTVDGNRREIGLGGVSYVGLADARAAAFANRQLARRGGDPMAAKRRSRVPTFRTACEQVEENANWKGVGPENRRSALERYCGSILDRRLDGIRRPDVIAIVARLMSEKPATGVKVHRWIRGVLAWGVAHEHLEFNVAEDIGAALPTIPNEQKHHAALPYTEVGAALDAIEASGATDAVKACLRFTVLTAVRSGEARGATWDEVNLEAAEWCIPKGRMKTGREHRVPLSPAAVETLERARRLHGSDDLCFPGRTSGSGKIDQSTLGYAVRRICGNRCTVHGFRSSFRDWARERTDAEHDVLEASLAHVVGTAGQRAYARSDLLERRRELMNRWAEFVTAPR